MLTVTSNISFGTEMIQRKGYIAGLSLFLCTFLWLYWTFLGPGSTPPIPLSPSDCNQLLARSKEASTFSGVPRLVHRIWIAPNVSDYTDITLENQKYWNGCIALNPGYKFVFWNRDDVIDLLMRHYPWFVPTYVGYSYTVQRVDAARYFILHHYGGIYHDMDAECLLPYDDILKNILVNYRVILSESVEQGRVANGFIVTQSRHPFMQQVIHHLNYTSRSYMIPHLTVLLSAGPVYFTRLYWQYPCKEDIYIMPVDQLSRFLIQKYAGTWHMWDEPIIVWLYGQDRKKKNLKTIAVSILVICFLLSIFYCYLRHKGKV